MSEATGRLRDAVMVIMAGGSGERFWPVSNRTTPKQLLRLHGGRTMLEQAFERAAGLVGADRVYIAAGERLRDAIELAVPELKPGHIIAEPFARNTAACLGLAASGVEALHGPETVMGVLTADHVIEEGALFTGAVQAAVEHAARTGALMTIGIKPTAPDTGFGYLEVGATLATCEAVSGPEPIRRVVRFTEKPDLATAERMLATGNYLWNSGMFFWKAGALLAAFERHQPEMAAAWARLRAARPPYGPQLLDSVFNSVASLAIDVAIMEKAENVAAVTDRFKWEDIGSWDSLARLRELDGAGNCALGPATVMDSRGNIIYNEVGADGAPVPEIVLHGVDDLLVVRTGRAILVTPRSHVQRVKEVVKHLNQNGRDDLL